MPLSNEQYNRIMLQYSQWQVQRRHEIDRRRKELYAREPGVMEIEAKIRRLAIDEAGRRIAQGSSESDSDIPQLISELRRQKASLIRNAGFDEDYLDVGYHCPDCKDTGYLEDGSRCHCLIQYSLELAYDSHTDLLSGLSLSDFSLQYYPTDTYDEASGKSPYDLANTALQKSRTFVDEFDTTFDNLLLIGKTGTGKTHLSCCIGSELLESGHSVVYLTSFELFSLMKKQMLSRDYAPADSYDRLFGCDLLIIDDLGTELANSMTISQLFELINERIRRRASTVISTNLDFNGLGATYTERLVSRFVGYYSVLNLMGPDIRIQKRQLKGVSYAEE